ncbi:MAG: GC-type dockerin domain-anchored protein [Planctomycetota bacterium]
MSYVTTEFGQQVTGLTYDPLMEEWQGSVSMPLCASEGDVELADITCSDYSLDLNEDGRLNGIDLVVASSMAGSTAVHHLDRFDDPDTGVLGVIDVEEQDRAEQLISRVLASGLSAGVLGDIDGDGDVDCDDACLVDAMAAPFAGQLMGSASYVVELDHDLDGDNDADDSLEVYPLLNPADLTTDGFSNGIPDGQTTLSDNSYYLTLWSASDPAADVAGSGMCNYGQSDGTVDLSDFSCYLSQWSQDVACANSCTP